MVDKDGPCPGQTKDRSKIYLACCVYNDHAERWQPQWVGLAWNTHGMGPEGVRGAGIQRSKNRAGGEPPRTMAVPQSHLTKGLTMLRALSLEVAPNPTV